MPKPFTRAEVEEFFARLRRLDPEPKTEYQRYLRSLVDTSSLIAR